MKKNYSHIVVVLDRSASMSARLEPTIEGYNAFMNKQREVKGECTVTLVQFDYPGLGHGIQTVFDFRPIASVPQLTRDTYAPRGNTALVDAIGHTIQSTGKALAAMAVESRPAQVYFVIQTDGQENASKDFVMRKEDNAAQLAWRDNYGYVISGQPLGNYTPKPVVADMIQHQRDVYNWDFIFLGADQDAISVAQQMNIDIGKTLAYAGGQIGTANTFAAVALNMSEARDQGVWMKSYTAAQRKQAATKDADVKSTGSNDPSGASDPTKPGRT